MAGHELLEQYNSFSSTSPRAEVHKLLQAVALAQQSTFSHADRTQFLSTLLKDVKAAGGKNSRLSLKEVAQALLCVKTFGRDPSGSQLLASADNLTTLLSFASTFKDDPDASMEALRCIANALLLQERARPLFSGKEVNGTDACVGMLEKATTPDQIFIHSRILFLCTVSSSPLITSLVEEKRHGKTMVELISSKLDLCLVAIQNGAKNSREAMTDLLKFTFHLLIHYPKMNETSDDGPIAMGEYWHHKLDGLLAPLLRVYHALPPTFPSPLTAPLTHVVHCLITIPINPSLQSIWFGSNFQTLLRSSNPSSPKSTGKTLQPRSSSRTRNDSSGTASTSSSHPSSPPKPSSFDRALSVLSAGRRSLSMSRSPSPNPSASPPFDVVLRTYDLIEVTFSHYFPGAVEVDHESVRARPKAEGSASTLDELCPPLVILMTRICTADDASRARVREMLVPADLDRSSALEGRPDLLGRCLRLLSSVYHASLKNSVGEMLFAIADSDASTLSSLVGYGNVAGYLFNKGIMHAPPPNPNAQPGPSTADNGKTVNPITGTTTEKQPAPEMSEEEKEREMEKLFVLFDRLEKTGTLPPSQNPIRRAMEKANEAG